MTNLQSAIAAACAASDTVVRQMGDHFTVELQPGREASFVCTLLSELTDCRFVPEGTKPRDDGQRDVGDWNLARRR